MKKSKKIISVFLILNIIVSIMCNLNIIAGAASTIVNVATSHLQTVFDVPNFSHGTVNSTNIGGISVGAANNRLFVVKSASNETNGILYYYNNIYNEAFANGTKQPKKIEFANALLGHANAMAVDNNYIYVAQWQKTELKNLRFYKFQGVPLACLQQTAS